MTIASRNGNFLGSQLPPGTRNQEPGTRNRDPTQLAAHRAAPGWKKFLPGSVERLIIFLSGFSSALTWQLCAWRLRPEPHPAAIIFSFAALSCREPHQAAPGSSIFFLYAVFERLELQSSSKLRCLGAASNMY
jgi:hypothetical protein